MTTPIHTNPAKLPDPMEITQETIDTAKENMEAAAKALDQLTAEYEELISLYAAQQDKEMQASLYRADEEDQMLTDDDEEEALYFDAYHDDIDYDDTDTEHADEGEEEK